MLISLNHHPAKTLIPGRRFIGIKIQGFGDLRLMPVGFGQQIQAVVLSFGIDGGLFRQGRPGFGRKAGTQQNFPQGGMSAANQGR